MKEAGRLCLFSHFNLTEQAEVFGRCCSESFELYLGTETCWPLEWMYPLEIGLCGFFALIFQQYTESTSVHNSWISQLHLLAGCGTLQTVSKLYLQCKV